MKQEVFYYDDEYCIAVKTTGKEVKKVLDCCNNRIRNLKITVSRDEILHFFDDRINCLPKKPYAEGYPGVKYVIKRTKNEFGDIYVKFVTVPDEEYEEE